jgi:ABC-2 type transport system permease protein
MIADLIASFRAEWLKLAKRPATWVLGVILVCLLVTLAYGFVLLVVVLIQHPTRGSAVAPPGTLESVQRQLYPSHFLSSVLSAFGGLGYGSAIALILGALAYGSEYGWATLKTVFTQRPGRVTTFAGKLLALTVALAIFALAMLSAGAAASAAMGYAYGHLTPWPAPVDIAKAFLTAWLIMGMWAALGVMLSVVFRQSALAIGLGVVYAIAIEGLIFNTLSLVTSLGDVERAFPGENAKALELSFGPNAGHPLAGPTQATLVVVGYLLVFVVISAILLRRRDVT